MSISGPTISEYSIKRKLGPASFLAADPSERFVVLKVLDADCLLKGQLHPMIKDRLGRVRELAHLGVANLQGAERDGEKAFLVWEYVEGKTLEEFVSEGGDGARLAAEIIAHVEALHVLGIVHGAIHAKNIIVTPTGDLKLTHVSPLLYHEESVDVAAVSAVLKQLGFEPNGSSLKEMAETIRAKRPENPVNATEAASESTHLRRLALLGALLAAVIGAGVAWVIWRNAISQPRDPSTQVMRSGGIL